MKLLIGGLALIVFVVLIDPSDSISRQEVINRARFWVQRKVRYSMTNYYPDPKGKKYRTDCSGYVSMAWALPNSLVTGTLPRVSKRINKNDLRSGDILIKAGSGGNGHTLIFDKWANNQRTVYWTYELHGPNGSPTEYRQRRYPYDNDNRYVPYRYNQITG